MNLISVGRRIGRWCVGELRVQRRAFVRDGALAAAGLLVCAAAMAETAVGGAFKTGTMIESL